MKHRVGFNRLGIKSSHRKALKRNMVTSLFREERITTTKAKAKEVRRVAEKMITRAKEDTVHNRRIIGKDIKDKSILAKLFSDISPRFKTRPGGYTRLLKMGFRQGDAAELVILELVVKAEKEKSEEKSGKTKKKKAVEAKSGIDSAGKAKKKTDKDDTGKKKSDAKPKVKKVEKTDETNSESVVSVADESKAAEEAVVETGSSEAESGKAETLKDSADNVEQDGAAE